FPNLPTGFQATPGNVAAGATGSFPVHGTAFARGSLAHFTVRGTSGTVVRTATVFVEVVPTNFNLNVNPPSTLATPIRVNPGDTIALSVTVVPISGFAGTVAIDFPNLPAGFQATPGNVAAGATGSFPVQVAATALGGLTQFTVRGTSGAVVRTATVFVEVVPTNFNLNVNPPSTLATPIRVNPGDTIALSVTVVPISGLAGTVSIYFPNLPTDFQATPGNVAAGATGSFPVQVAAIAPRGLAQFTVRGTSLSPFTTLFRSVEVVPTNFNLNVNPPSTLATPIRVNPGGTIALSVTVRSEARRAGKVGSDLPTLPTDFQATPGNVAAGATGSFPVQVAAIAPGGLAQFTVRGTSGTVVRTATVFVEVVPTNFNLNVNPPSTLATPIRVNPGGTIALSVTVVPISDFTRTLPIYIPNLTTDSHSTPGNVAADATGSS